MLITWTNEQWYSKYSKLWRKKTLRILGVPIFTLWVEINGYT